MFFTIMEVRGYGTVIPNPCTVMRNVCKGKYVIWLSPEFCRPTTMPYPINWLSRIPCTELTSFTIATCVTGAFEGTDVGRVVADFSVARRGGDVSRLALMGLAVAGAFVCTC